MRIHRVGSPRATPLLAPLPRARRRINQRRASSQAKGRQDLHGLQKKGRGRTIRG